MAAWQAGGLTDNPRRETILTATREHDNGWHEEDESMHVDERGEPLDFISVSADVKQRIWPRAAARLASVSPYVAALVAQHELTIFASLRHDPIWRSFFTLMERTRNELLARVAPDEATAAGLDYDFVRLGDQLSLVFCNGRTAPMASVGCQIRLNGSTLEVAPDPFGGQRVPLSVPARVVPARAYPSASAIRAAYAAAPPVALEGAA